MNAKHSKLVRSIVHVALIGAFTAAPAVQAAGWKLESTKGSLKIYKRSVPGSDIKEVKAIGTINAPAHAIMNVLNDVEHYDDFMPYVDQSKVLSRKGRRVVSYQFLDTPFISDRDYTIVRKDKSSWNEDGTPLYRLSWSAAKPTVGPAPKDGVVRLKVVDGSWKLEALGPNKTKGTYYLNTDPGGSLPAFVVNMANDKGIGGLFEVVEEQAKKKKYADKMPAFPEASKKPSAKSPEPAAPANVK